MFYDEFVQAAEANELQDDAVVARFEHDRQQFHDVRLRQRVHLSFPLQLVRSSDDKQVVKEFSRNAASQGDFYEGKFNATLDIVISG